MTRTQIYLSEAQKRLLKRIAIEQDETFSEIVRKLIDKGIEAEKKEKLKKLKERKTPIQMLLEAAQQAEEEGWEGPGDGSVNHDKYLYGKDMS